MLTLMDMAQAAVAACEDDPEGNDLTVAKILRLLDVRDSTLNTHLANPLNHPRLGALKRREVALSGKEPIHGEFITLTYCSHDPFVLLDDYTSIEALEKFLASGSGLVNFYITYCIAFLEGQIETYRIAYTEVDGSVGRFDKNLQNSQGPQPAERAVERWVVWNSDTLTTHGRWPTPAQSC